MVKEVFEMEETKRNIIEVPIKDKYLLTIRETGAYFGLGKNCLEGWQKKMLKGFAILIWK